MMAHGCFRRTYQTPNNNLYGQEASVDGEGLYPSRCKEAINGVLMGEEPKDVLAQLDGAVLIKMLR